MRLIVEVFVPAIDIRFDFSLPAKMTADIMAPMVAEAISAQSRLESSGVDAKRFGDMVLFYQREDGAFAALKSKQTLSGAGVKDGSQLILV